MHKIKIILFLWLILGVTIGVAAITKSNSLELLGKTIYVDPGHGGRDDGTSYNNILEKDLNLAIALKLKEELLNKGAIVFMTREEDIDLSKETDSSKKKGDLQRRVKMIEDAKADLYISIHINWYQESKYKGIDIMYNDINKNNKILAETLYNRMKQDLNVRSIKNIDDYMYRNINRLGLLIECGFLSNSDERYLLQQKQYQEKLTKKIVQGIIDYF